MAKAPDWLLNMTNSAPNLVEDSPQFRAEEQKTQMANLNKAAEEAMKEVNARTRQSQAQTIMHQMQALDGITPMPTPLAGPDQKFFGDIPADRHTPMTPNVPGPGDFAPPSPQTPQSLAGPDAQMAPTDPSRPQQAPVSEDPHAEVQRIAQATGIPVQTVASMALLGGDIGKLEQRGQQGQQSAPPTDPQQPPAPQPLMQAPPGPPPAPQQAPGPTAPPPVPTQLAG